MELFSVRPDDRLSPATSALVANLLTGDGSLCIGVWQSRANPYQRYSSRLLFYNKNLQDMCDARTFGEGDMKSMIPANLVFLTEQSAADYRASLWRGIDIVDNLHCGTIRRGTAIIIHISMLGRKHIVDCEMFGMYSNGKMTEYIIAERPLPPTSVVPRDLQRRYSLTSEYVLRDCSSTISDEGADDVPSVYANPEEPPREFEWQLPAKRRSSWVWIEDSKEQSIEKADASSVPFSCQECRTKHTTQRRRGPRGPNTLCNRCGLRWNRTQKKLLEQSAAPTNFL